MDSEENDFNQGKITKIFLFSLGLISLILAIIGIVLPILPTTPFLLLAAACFIRSSPRAYNWLLSNRIFGQYIRDYREGKGIPSRVKIYTISLLWITILISAFMFIKVFLIQLVLIIIAIIVSVHILFIRPKKDVKAIE